MTAGAKFSTSTSALRPSSISSSLPRSGLQIKHDAALAAVQGAERIVTVTGALARHVTERWLDLDDIGARHRHQEASVGSLENVTQVEDAYADERQRNGGHRDSSVRRGSLTVAVPGITF